eukprot:13929941-Heterocapsa_arctica.AAC.1
MEQPSQCFIRRLARGRGMGPGGQRFSSEIPFEQLRAPPVEQARPARARVRPGPDGSPKTYHSY